MRLFVWKYVGQCTDNYHNGGGVLVIASDLDAARDLIRTRRDIPVECEAYSEAPDEDRECEAPETVIVFQDAGCC